MDDLLFAWIVAIHICQLVSGQSHNQLPGATSHSVGVQLTGRCFTIL